MLPMSCGKDDKLLCDLPSFNYKYRAPGKSMYFLLSRTQAGPGRTVKQEQEEISRNHVQTFIYLSVLNSVIASEVLCISVSKIGLGNSS